MKYFEKLLWWLITGQRGGLNRARIIKKLHDRPYNAHQLSVLLNLDYRTIRHHIKILVENKVISGSGDSYGKIYFLSDEMENNYEIFQGIWDKYIKNDE
ncbi:MAG: winged helix-turn-helix domain-containing protein [Methanobacterium sp.]|nr:winged helix-turn-helix domain-containing protein [Methanobacterium sp.]